MAVLSELPPELIFLTISFLTREKVLDPDNCLPLAEPRSQGSECVPDLHSINSLSQTNRAFHYTLDQTLYDLCASVETLGKLALVFAVTQQSESTVDRLVAVGVRLDTQFNCKDDCCGLLHIAAALGHTAMVIKLLGMCGEELVHIQSLNKRTALDYAARYGHMDVVQILAPIPQPGSSHSDYVSIALLEAVGVGDIEISRCLISEGADVNFFHGRFAGGSRPLYVAVCLRNLGLVQLLLISGADPDGDKPYIPLFVAARGGDLGILRALVGGGADIHVRDDQRRNVLVSCGTNMGPLCFFLERGVDPNNQDRHGQTVLQKACGKDHAAYGRDFVEVLCQYGAALDIANHKGETAVDLAMENGLAGVLLIMERFAQSPELRARIAKWVRKRKRWAWGGANGPIW